MLSSPEWTAYEINCDQPRRCNITLRVRGEETGAEAYLQVNNHPVNVVVAEKDWKEVKVGPIQFNRGINRLKWMANRKTVQLDWLEVQLAGEEQKTAAAKTSSTAN